MKRRKLWAELYRRLNIVLHYALILDKHGITDESAPLEDYQFMAEQIEYEEST